MTDGQLLSLMAAAIAALFGVLMRVIWMVITRDERIIEQESAKTRDTLNQIADSLVAVRTAMEAQIDQFKEVRTAIGSGAVQLTKNQERMIQEISDIRNFVLHSDTRPGRRP